MCLTSTLHLIIFYGNPSGEVSKSCTASLKEVTEVIAVATSGRDLPIYIAGWTGAMRLKFFAQGNNSNSN